jgi:hypothetical protein
MSVPGITFQLLDGRQAAAHEDELRALHAEVYADSLFADRFRVQRRQPGFVLAVARLGRTFALAELLVRASWRRRATAATWSATRPGCRCGRPPPGGGT